MRPTASSLAIFRRFHLLREAVTGILLAAILLPTSYSQSPPPSGPSWWTTRGVIAPGKVADDFAVINQGQLKNIVRMAVAEMNLKLTGGAGSALNQMVASWGGINNGADDFATVNLGQLRAVAAPIQERLLSAGVITALPAWVNATPQISDDNAALANIGQVKHLFSFTLPDQTSIPPGDVEIGDDTLSPFVISYSGWRSAEILPRLSTDTAELPQVNKYRCVVQQYEWSPLPNDSPYRPYKQLVTPEIPPVLLSNLEEAVLWTGLRNQQIPKFIITGTVVEHIYTPGENPGLQTVREYEGSVLWNGIGEEPALGAGALINSWAIVSPFGPYPSAVEQAWRRQSERKYALMGGNTSWTEAGFTNESYYAGAIPLHGVRVTREGPVTSPLHAPITPVELATENPISTVNSLPTVAYNNLALPSKGGLVATSTFVLSTINEKYLDGGSTIDSPRYVGKLASGNVSIAWRTDWHKSLSYQEKVDWLNRYMVTTKTYDGNSEPQVVTTPLYQLLGVNDSTHQILQIGSSDLLPGSQKIIELSINLAAASPGDPGNPDPGNPTTPSNPPFTLSYQFPGKRGIGAQTSYRNPRNKVTGESVPIHAPDFNQISLGYSMDHERYEMSSIGEWDTGTLDLLPKFRSFHYPSFGPLNQRSVHAPMTVRYSERARTLPRETPMHLPDSGDPNEVVDYNWFRQEEKKHYVRIYSNEILPLGHSMTVIPVVSVRSIMQDPISGETYIPANSETQKFSLSAHTFVIPPNDQKSEPKEFEMPAMLEYSENRQISINLTPISVVQPKLKTIPAQVRGDSDVQEVEKQPNGNDVLEEVSSIRFCRWTEAFDSTASFDHTFYQRDRDRFHIRINAELPELTKIKITSKGLSQTVINGALVAKGEDFIEEVSMHKHNGYMLSDPILLVSDGDDDANYNATGVDNGKGDVTLQADFNSPIEVSFPDYNNDKVTFYADEPKGVILVAPVYFSLSSGPIPLDTIINIELQVQKAKEVYRQIGVNLETDNLFSSRLPQDDDPNVPAAFKDFRGFGSEDPISSVMTQQFSDYLKWWRSQNSSSNNLNISNKKILIAFIDTNQTEPKENLITVGHVTELFEPATVIISLAVDSRDDHFVMAHEIGHIVAVTSHPAFPIPYVPVHRLMIRGDFMRYEHDHLDSKRLDWSDEEFNIYKMGNHYYPHGL